jgi:hypothetical protein
MASLLKSEGGQKRPSVKCDGGIDKEGAARGSDLEAKAGTVCYRKKNARSANSPGHKEIEFSFCGL